jgi:hypothetical protein
VLPSERTEPFQTAVCEPQFHARFANYVTNFGYRYSCNFGWNSSARPNCEKQLIIIATVKGKAKVNRLSFR